MGGSCGGFCCNSARPASKENPKRPPPRRTDYGHEPTQEAMLFSGIPPPSPEIFPTAVILRAAVGSLRIGACKNRSTGGNR